MSGNNKSYIFAAVLVVTAIGLWGIKGILQLLPGPNPK